MSKMHNGLGLELAAYSAKESCAQRAPPRTARGCRGARRPQTKIRRPLWGHQASEITLFSSFPSSASPPSAITKTYKDFKRTLKLDRALKRTQKRTLKMILKGP